METCPAAALAAVAAAKGADFKEVVAAETRAQEAEEGHQAPEGHRVMKTASRDQRGGNIEMREDLLMPKVGGAAKEV